MSGWLLDTNVISEWHKPRPERRVAEFVRQQRLDSLFVSVVCLAELRRGAALLVDHDERELIVDWIDKFLRPYFSSRTLEVTEEVILVALEMVHQTKKRRSTPSLVDTWIAATARHHNLAVVTRNTKDFVHIGVPLFNPWTGERFNGA